MVEVITHGGGEALYHAFNAVAILFQKKGVMATVLYIVINFAIIAATTQMVITQDGIKAFKWAIGFVLVMNALTLPKIDVMIVDRAFQYQKKVDNVPFVLGFAAAFSSQLGDFMAKKFDQVFAPAGLEYTKTGIAMASKLVSTTARMTFVHPASEANLKGFIQNCMLWDIAKGKYNLQELKEAEDTWDFLAKTSSPIRGFAYNTTPFTRGKAETQIKTCREVAAIEKGRWNDYLSLAASKYSRLFFPDNPRAFDLLIQHLPVSYEYLTGMSQDASLILRQNIMRNLIRDGLIELNATNGTTDVIRSAAEARALEQQKTAYALHGDTASLSLSTLKVLFEVLIYSLFPMAASIALFPGGFRVLKEYCIMMFSIQAWAPMYAILNMVLNVYAKSKSLAAVTIGAKGATSQVLAFSTIPQLTEANEWISAVAGYGMSLIPFLSYGIFKYGAGALTQISGHFGSVAQSAVSHAAEEAVSGNRSLANTHFANHSQNNTSGFKHNTNVEVATGKTSMQDLDGSYLHTMPDGTPIRDMRPAMGDIGGDIKVSDQIQASFSENAHKSVQNARRDSQAASDSISSALSMTHDFRESRAKSTDGGQTYTTSETTGSESSWGKYVDLVEQFARENGVTYSAATRIFAKISTGGNIPGLGSAEAGAEFNASVLGNQTFTKAMKFNEDNKMSELLQQSTREAKERRLNIGNSEGNQWSDAIGSSLSKAGNQIQSASAELHKAESYQQQANYYKQHGVSIDQSYSKDYQQHLVANHGITGAHKIMSNPTFNSHYMNAYATSKANAVLEKHQAQMPTTEQAIVDNHGNNVESVQNFNAPEQKHEANNQLIGILKENSGLGAPVSTELKDTVQQKMEQNKQEKFKKEESIRKEHEAYIAELKAQQQRDEAKNETYRGMKVPKVLTKKGNKVNSPIENPTKKDNN